MGVKIAITGRIRSGKDTVAKVFIEDGYKEFKFSTGITEIIQKYFPEDWAKGKPRKHYQSIGQNLRQLDSDVWVKYCLRRVNSYLQDNPDANIIIDDMRQYNEGIKLKEAGFILIRVKAPEEIRIQRMLNAGDVFDRETLDHETEQQSDLIPVDLTLNNDVSLEVLYGRVAMLKKAIESGIIKG